jgi:cAMP phosphodiesterase
MWIKMKKNSENHHKMWKKNGERTQSKGLFHRDENKDYHRFCGDLSNPSEARKDEKKRMWKKFYENRFITPNRTNNC